MNHCVLLFVLCFPIALHVPACRATCPPGSVVERGISPHVKQLIVNIHNEYRRQNAMGKVSGQPKAADMLMMTWDESIAQQAQAVAETCEFKHVKVNDPRFSVGQNLYTSYNSEDLPGANWTRAVQSWFDEHKDYHFGNRVYDHYTQVIWATSDKVGCGYVKYRTNNGVKRLYVCHYGPAGNIVGRAPYQVGNGCDNLCLSTDSDKYKGPKLIPIPSLPKWLTKTIPRPPKWLTKPIPRPPRPLTYPSNTLPKPKPYSPYSKPRPPKQMPYQPKPRPGSPKYRPPIQQKPKAQSGYIATKEDAVLAMLMYFLIEKQAELEAKKAHVKQQEPDYEDDDYDEDEYYDEPEYEDETDPQEADGDDDGQNDPHQHGQYRRVGYDAGTYNTRTQRYPKFRSSKEYVIRLKNSPQNYRKYRIVSNGAGTDSNTNQWLLNYHRMKN